MITFQVTFAVCRYHAVNMIIYKTILKRLQNEDKKESRIVQSNPLHQLSFKNFRNFKKLSTTDLS